MLWVGMVRLSIEMEVTMKKRYVPSARPYDDNGTMLHVIVLANPELVQPTVSKTAVKAYISKHAMCGLRAYLMHELEANGIVSWYSKF